MEPDTSATFIGISLTPGKHPFAYAAIDHKQEIIALNSGAIEDTLAFTAGQRSAIVCVGAPSGPNLNKFILTPPPAEKPHRGRKAAPPSMRKVEFELEQLGISIYHTPADENHLPPWVKQSFQLYQNLREAHYQPFSPDHSPLEYLESQPDAVFWSLLGHAPFTSGTLESRLQRQLILYENGLHVPDPMDFFEEVTRHKLLRGILPLNNIYTQPELDALVLAFTAWLSVCQPERTIQLGDPEEGQIIIPSLQEQAVMAPAERHR
jgi:hypothetical protein